MEQESKPQPVAAKALALGRRIAQKREQLGYTQAQLGAKFGLTDNAVTQWETGRTMPRPKRLERIALELDTSVEWLLTGGEADEVSRAQTHAELEALTILRSISFERQGAALAVLQALADSENKK